MVRSILTNSLRLRMASQVILDVQGDPLPGLSYQDKVDLDKARVTIALVARRLDEVAHRVLDLNEEA